jgi:hypothetical protein
MRQNEQRLPRILTSRRLVIPFCCLLAACQSAGEFRTQAAAVRAGDSADTVIARMGDPGSRSFRGKAEAWQYCQTGVLSPTDSYTTVWLLEGQVVAMTTKRAAFGVGDCSAFFPEIDWGQAPPDVRIAVEVKNE